MDNKVYNVGDKVVLRKKHPCGGFEWEIIKLGADIKIKCTTCGRTIFVPRVELNKKIKKIITGGE